jgi:hypothetical protein
VVVARVDERLGDGQLLVGIGPAGEGLARVFVGDGRRGRVDVDGVGQLGLQLPAA